MSNRSKYYLLALFAAAMALLEAAVVVYMRRLYYPENPLDIFPLDFLSVYDPRLELAREASTIVMLIVVALLAGRARFVISARTFLRAGVVHVVLAYLVRRRPCHAGCAVCC